eukprot:SAG22_NODE_171_length_16646_cov_6.580528_12_plen_54_part_00
MDNDESVIFFLICVFAVYVTFFWQGSDSSDLRRKKPPTVRHQGGGITRFNPGY